MSKRFPKRKAVWEWRWQHCRHDTSVSVDAPSDVWDTRPERNGWSWWYVVREAYVAGLNDDHHRHHDLDHDESWRIYDAGDERSKPVPWTLDTTSNSFTHLAGSATLTAWSTTRRPPIDTVMCSIAVELCHCSENADPQPRTTLEHGGRDGLVEASALSGSSAQSSAKRSAQR